MWNEVVRWAVLWKKLPWGGAWIRKSLQCILSRVLKKLEHAQTAKAHVS